MPTVQLGDSTMIKYTKKQQRFISDLYGYDHEKLENRVEYLAESCVGYEAYLEEFEIIFGYSRELIRGNTSNAEKLFNLSEKVQEQLQCKCDPLIEQSNSGDLPEEMETELDMLGAVVDSLRILNNLHPK